LQIIAKTYLASQHNYKVFVLHFAY